MDWQSAPRDQPWPSLADRQLPQQQIALLQQRVSAFPQPPDSRDPQRHVTSKIQKLPPWGKRAK